MRGMHRGFSSVNVGCEVRDFMSAKNMDGSFTTFSWDTISIQADRKTNFHQIPTKDGHLSKEFDAG